MAETVGGGTKVILYTTPNCSTCDDARAGLTAEGVEYEERDVMKNKDWYNEALEYSVTVPIIIRDDEVEYGFRAISAAPSSSVMTQKTAS